MKHIILLVLFFCVSILAQEETGINKITEDSIENTVVSDTLLTSVLDTVKRRSDIDSVVYATSKDSLIFFVNKKKMNIYGEGYLKYKETELKSGIIYIDFETSNIEAYGIENDSIPDRFVETPVLLDKGDEFKGNQMKYNFKTKRGFITYASTKEEQASYSGAKIKKVDEETFFIEKGVYSTCDHEHPHYFFFGQQMKMIQKEQVIGKWIWLFIGDVPLPMPVPFAVFPLQSGRRSGIIVPAFGDRGGYGRYLSKLGYFWALSDYMDVNLTADYYFKSGYNLNSRFRYVKRYEFSGNIEASYSNLYRGEKTDIDRTEQKDWRLFIVHNHTLSPTSRIDANLEFLTGDYISNNSTNLNKVLNKDINSNFSYYKNWEEAGASMSLNYRRNQNLESGDIFEDLPSVSFNKTQFYPFRKKFSIDKEAWYEGIGFSYSGNFLNKRQKKDGQLAIRGGIQHSVSINVSPKVGYFTLSPYFSYREYWYNKRISKYSVASYDNSDSVITNDEHRLSAVRTFNMGVTASTKIYGIVQPNSFGVQAIRHIIQPSLTYNYQPNFSTDKWGYYGYYTSITGESVKYNLYEREVYGGAQNYESQSLGFSVQNTFEMKTKADPRDTTAKEKKFQLLNLRASLNYNFAADSLKFSDLNLGYNTQIGDFLNLSGSSSYTLYKYDRNIKREINKYLISEGSSFLRLKYFTFSISTSISGDKLKSEDNKEEDENQLDNYVFSGTRYQGLYDVGEADFSIPWSISLNYNYNINKTDPDNTQKYSNVGFNVNFNLTKSWKFTVNGNYDIENKRFSAPQINISRDLHCWTMNFNWNPLGVYSGYRFEIRVKASQLQDLKLTKSSNFFSGR